MNFMILGRIECPGNREKKSNEKVTSIDIEHSEIEYFPFDIQKLGSTKRLHQRDSIWGYIDVGDGC